VSTRTHREQFSIFRSPKSGWSCARDLARRRPQTAGYAAGSGKGLAVLCVLASIRGTVRLSCSRRNWAVFVSAGRWHTGLYRHLVAEERIGQAACACSAACGAILYPSCKTGTSIRTTCRFPGSERSH